MQLGIYANQYLDDGSSFGFPELFEVADATEAAGLDTLAVGERHFYEPGFLDPFTCLSAVAARTDLGVASNILILPAHHPVHVAERIAAIDRLSGGESLWGLGIGYRPSEIESFGASMDRRGKHFAESVGVLKRLLAGERFDHDGEFYGFEDGFVSPTPLQEPHPPLFAGGSGSVALKRAAYRCDGFTAASDTPEAIAEEVEAYRDALEEMGKDREDGEVALMLNGFVADSVEAAREALTPSMFDLLELYATWGNPHAERPSWEDVEDEVLAGPPARVAERLAAYRDAGVDHVFVRTQFPGMETDAAVESIRRLGDDVLPTL
jgi:alkanesulfonate monooxygenase SsuD/methylene tetrahydromethanopterin reductase-like flavin-dependent oxidoreductase (luciferase family)